jgi:hypothetical protein
MRHLAWTIVLALTALAASWHAIAVGLSTAAQTRLQGSGLAGASALSVMGFPGRFDLELQAPRLRSEDGLLEWSAPSLRLQVPSYRLTTLAAEAADVQMLRVGQTVFALHHDGMRANLSLSPTPSLPLRAAGFEAQKLRVFGASGFELAAAALNLSLSAEPLAASYALSASLADLDLPLISLAHSLPPRLEELSASARVRLSAPLDRHLRPEAGPQIEQIDLHASQMRWGDAQLSASGSLRVTPSGQPEGRLMLDTDNWRAVLARMVELGLVRRELLPSFEAIFAQLAAGKDALSIPLDFQRGRMSLGPLPLGAAPVLR